MKTMRKKIVDDIFSMTKYMYLKSILKNHIKLSKSKSTFSLKREERGGGKNIDF